MSRRKPEDGPTMVPVFILGAEFEVRHRARCVDCGRGSAAHPNVIVVDEDLVLCIAHLTERVAACTKSEGEVGLRRVPCACGRYMLRPAEVRHHVGVECGTCKARKAAAVDERAAAWKLYAERAADDERAKEEHRERCAWCFAHPGEPRFLCPDFRAIVVEIDRCLDSFAVTGDGTEPHVHCQHFACCACGHKKDVLTP